MRTPRPLHEDSSDPRPPSRSQKKRDSRAVQDLGCRLAALPEATLARLNPPPDLDRAIADLRGMTKHEARRRQLQFIGAIMREIDVTPLARAMAAIEAGDRDSARAFQVVETRRDALVAGDESGLEDLLAAVPEAQRPELRTRIRQLARNARQEAEKDKPQRSGRALFRLLRDLDAGCAVPDDPAAAADEE